MELDLSELPTLADPKLHQMGTLLQKMTGDTSQELKFSRTQVNAWIEVALPRLAKMPGMPADLECDLEKPSEDSWVLRITRPS